MSRDYNCIEGSAGKGVLFGVGAAILGVGLFAASGAISGAVGAAILESAGHKSYDPTASARTGALGASILSIPYIAIVACLTAICSNSESKKANTLGTIILGVAFTAAAGALGNAILEEYDNPGSASAATAVGAAVVGGCTAALSACCGR